MLSRENQVSKSRKSTAYAKKYGKYENWRHTLFSQTLHILSFQGKKKLPHAHRYKSANFRIGKQTYQNSWQSTKLVLRENKVDQSTHLLTTITSQTIITSQWSLLHPSYLFYSQSFWWPKQHPWKGFYLFNWFNYLFLFCLKYYFN